MGCGFRVGLLVGKAQKVDKPCVSLAFEIQQPIPGDDLLNPGKQVFLVRRERQLGRNGLQDAQLVQPLDADSRFAFIADVAELVEQARFGQLLHKIEGKSIFDEFFRIAADAKIISLLKTYSPEAAGGIFHKAQGVQHANRAILDIPLAAEKVDQLPKRGTVQPDCQGVDGEVAAEKIHLERRKFHRGKSRRVLVVFQPCGGNIDPRFRTLAIGENDTRWTQF